MNILEHYIQPGYHHWELSQKQKKAMKLPVNERWIWFQGNVDCYGDIRCVKRPFYIDDWKEIEKQGYYLG